MCGEWSSYRPANIPDIRDESNILRGLKLNSSLTNEALLVCVCVCDTVHSHCLVFWRHPSPITNWTHTHTHSAVLSPCPPNESIIKATWPLTFRRQPQTPQPLLLWLTKWLSNKPEGKGQRKPWGMQCDARRLLWCPLARRFHPFLSAPGGKSQRLIFASAVCQAADLGDIKGAVCTAGLGTYSCEMWCDICKQKRFHLSWSFFSLSQHSQLDIMTITELLWEAAL